MLFHIRMTDYPVPRRTREMRDAHWRYLDAFAAQILVRGPTQNDEGTVMRSSLLFGEFADRAAAERFVAEEPTQRAGAYMHAEIFGWNNTLKRRWSDFARRPGQVYWYVRGYAKAGAARQRETLLAAHKDYLEPWDAEQLIVRGGLSSEAGEWVGSASLITLPDRKAVEAFAAEEPFCKSGLFERVLIERFKPGGEGG